ncbi:class I SAM-dependent methyltransferase [Thermodesulfobacteriota bacterium]
MESDEETLRLELKTDTSVVADQAKWAGIKPGMRVADIGCGPGLTTSILHKLNQPNGETIGIDFSDSRLDYAKQKYSQKNLEFVLRDVRDPLDDLGSFDFIWVRFLLEYYAKDSFEIVKNLTKILKLGGSICLIDLDHNCLSHYGIPERLEKNVNRIINEVAVKANFDPFIGRKLYSFLYDLEFEDIVVNVSAHHNIYGPLEEKDKYNWLKKVELAPQIINYKFKDYEGGYEEYLKEFHESFSNPRRFTYTPLISCRGTKPK